MSRINKILKSLVATLLVTSLVFYVQTGDKMERTSRRNLIVTETNYTDLCVNKNVTALYTFDPKINKISTSFSGYLSNLTFVKEDQTDNIRKALNGDTDARNSLIVNLFAPYIIFIVFGAITIIFWIIYWVCCCKSCCCCKGEQTESKCGINTIAFILIILAVAGIIAVCIIGFVFSSRLPEKLDASQCSLLRLYLDVKSGELKTTTPKWIGVDGILGKFNDLSASLDTIKANSNNAFKDTSYTSTDQNNYNKFLETSYNNFKGRTTSSPTPNGSSPFTPGFIANYGPSTTDATTTSNIRQEFAMTIVGTTNSLNSLKGYTTTINDNINSAKGVFTSATDSLTPLKTNIDKIDKDYVTKFVEFKSDSAKPLNTAFIILFAIIIGGGIIFLVFTLLFVCCDIKCFRFISHIAWNIVTLITIALFVIAGVFGLLGTVFLYLGPFIEAFFENKTLVYILGDQKAADILDTCMNKGGDLQKILAGDTSMVTTLSSFVDQANTLDSIYKNVTSVQGSVVVNNYIEYYKKLDKNVALDVSTSDEGAPKALAKLTLYTDDTVESTSLQNSCSSKTYDKWVSDDTACPAGTQLISSNIPDTNIGEQSCLNVRSWTETTTASRYSKRPNSCSGSLNIATTASGYVASINKYASDSSVIIAELQKEMTSINNQYSNSANKIKDALNSVKSVTDPFLNILQGQIGSGKLFDMVNCSFLSIDSLVIVNTMKPTGDAVIQLAACLASLALLNWILLFFGLIFLYRRATANQQSGNLVSEKAS